MVVSEAPEISKIHIINPLWDASGGSEWRTLSLYNALRDSATCTLWTQFQPAREFAAKYDIKRIVPKTLSFPKRDVFVFVGVYFPYGRWLALTRPRRIVVIYNTYHHAQFSRNRRILSFPGLPRFELVYASGMIKEAVGQPGEIETSLIDLETFVPRSTSQNPANCFTVGRLSRDVPEKHHVADVALYQKLAAAGCGIRIMGGTSLRELVEDSSFIELLPASSQDAVEFLHGLDCFYYRTSEDWTETFGRVVFEAMACGLPVVCHRNGGYAAHIKHGTNGFLFDSDDEAMKIILELKRDVPLRTRVGSAGRNTAEALFGLQASGKVAGFYLK